MSEPTEIVVLNPMYWSDRAQQLAAILRQDRVVSPIGDPTGKVADPGSMLTIVGPGYWGTQPVELQNVLLMASGSLPLLEPGAGHLGVGISPSAQERLTFTVEEAAAVLGISRAFAYESVRRGDIPHIKIGRRILIPKAKLQELLSSPLVPDDESGAGS